MQMNDRKKLEALRREIAIGDADIEAGRFTEYESAEVLLQDILGPGTGGSDAQDVDRQPFSGTDKRV